jgi:hypothetical protein
VAPAVHHALRSAKEQRKTIVLMCHATGLGAQVKGADGRPLYDEGQGTPWLLEKFAKRSGHTEYDADDDVLTAAGPWQTKAIAKRALEVFQKRTTTNG